jgi:hypothetical protein
MKRYWVEIFAKADRKAEVYSAGPIEAQDDASAKAAAEVMYREYESMAIRTGSKHTAEFYELKEGERIVYISNRSKSLLTAAKNVWSALQLLRRKT